ncbi:MAG TPA: hypothetical protein VN653_10790 [Anaerolineales bacterium]|nr:hypothetical protein [Anaerolineales bacterium]
MLRNRIITPGKCYVNNRRKVAREVLSADNQTIKFYTYHLDTGNSCGSPSESTRQDFIQWADREASPAEIASLQFLAQDALFRAPQLPKVETPERP